MKRFLCIWLPSLPAPNRNGRADNVALESIAARVQQQISPLVALETLDKQPWAGRGRHRCEALLCELSGVVHLFGGEAGLLRAADAVLQEFGMTGRMAIADSVGAAWAVAHYHPPAASGAARTGSAGALRACDLAFTPAAHIIPPGCHRQAIESLPVESLRIGVETAATLSRLGVSVVGQLLRLPRSGLAPRLGQPLVRRIEQALGEVEEPIAVYRAPVGHEELHQLEYPTGDQAILADRIKRLVKQVRAGLAACQRGALRMTCRLDLLAHPPLTLSVGLFAPTTDSDHLSGLLIHQLETTRLPAAVESLTVSVPLTGPLRPTQTFLFGNDFTAPRGMHGSEVSRLIDSLGGRLGCESVVGIRLSDDPLPERAFRTIPLAGGGAAKVFSSVAAGSRVAAGSHWVRSHRKFPSSSERAAAVAGPSPHDAMRRPLALLATPVPIAVMVDGGDFCFSVASSAVPQAIRMDETAHSIVRFWGSERIETSWWNGPSIRRDYYRVETSSGRWYWIYRNLAPPNKRYHWMLHGRFN